MPIYVYKCPKCKHTREVIHLNPMDGFYGQTCFTPGCTQKIGEREIPTLMDRQPTAASVRFAGGGWAKDGYSDGSKNS